MYSHDLYIFFRDFVARTDRQFNTAGIGSEHVPDVGELVEPVRRNCEVPGQVVPVVTRGRSFRHRRHLVAGGVTNAPDPPLSQIVRRSPPDTQSRSGQPQHGRRPLGPRQQQSLRRARLQVSCKATLQPSHVHVAGVTTARSSNCCKSTPERTPVNCSTAPPITCRCCK
jgi:hypothetical protein